jgi:hypothetical protein
MFFKAKPEFFHRLTRASIPEIAYRLKQHLTDFFLKYALKVNKIPLKVPEIYFSDVIQLPGLKKGRRKFGNDAQPSGFTG